MDEIKIKVPELAESITEGTIAEWLKKVGDNVEKGESIVELETDKVNIEIHSDFSGKLIQLKFSEGDTVKVGETIAIIDPKSESITENNLEESSSKASKSTETKERTAPLHIVENSLNRPIASPAARKLAREKGIDLNDIRAMDPLGRIRKQDVTLHEEENKHPLPTIPKKDRIPKPADDPKPIIVEKMSRRRQTIAQHLLVVKQTTAMLTTFNEVDLTAILELRKRKKGSFFNNHNVKLGLMSFFTKATVAALKRFPYLNAEIQGEELLIKKFYDIGIAVAVEDGLVVPIVRNADRKSFAEIETDIATLAEKAKNHSLALMDLQGGTFTITNGGVFGSLLSTPILNGSQVGILGMHTIQLRPVAIDKERMENRSMMYVALSYDHRIVDGKEAVRFLKTIKELLEDPEDLLLEG